MNQRGKIRYVFASGNTSQGYHSFIPGLIENLSTVYILKGASGSGRSTFIRQAGLAISEKGYEVEFFVSPLNASSLEGVLVRQLDTAIVNGSLPCPVEPRYPGVTGEIINLGEHWDREEILMNKDEIKNLVDQINRECNEAQGLLRQAKLKKEKLKQFWVPGLNLEKMETLLERLTREILDHQPGEKHYFASSISSQGLVSYVDELSYHCNTRYILKGPPGSGKSTILEAIGEKARQRGYKVEYYHNGLNLDSLDMILITTLSVAVIDSGGLNITARSNDIIIDTRACQDNKPDEKDQMEMNETQRCLESLLLETATVLRDAEFYRKRLQKIYTRAMDFNEVDRIRARVIEEILDN